jgi:ATP-binding cassette, subfamily B, bacterial
MVRLPKTRMISTKFKQIHQQLAYLPQTFQLIWQASQRWTIAWILLLIIQGILPAITVSLTQTLVDGLVRVTGSNTALTLASLQPLLSPGLGMAGVLLLSEIVQSSSDWIRTAQAELVQDYISGLVHQKSGEIDYACYESSEYSDRLARAQEESSSRSLALLENTGSVLQSSITLGTIAIILIPYGFWLPILLVGGALPAFLVAIKNNLRQYEWSQRTTVERRRLQYYKILMTDPWPAAELRLFGYGPYFHRIYQATRARLRLEQLRLVRIQSIGRLLASLVTLVLLGIVLIIIGRQVLAGQLTLGHIALFYQAFNQGQAVTRSFLSNLGQIYKNSLFISNLFDFLNLPSNVKEPLQPHSPPDILKQGIRLQQITFRYPGSDTPVLEDFSLHIPANKITAIVGDNGAGKSTLLKLLCRFYDPELGSILMDGTDIRNFAVCDLRRLITILFQTPLPYYISAAENITLGDLNAPGDSVHLEAAAKAAGIHDKLTSLPNGYGTTLGKWLPNGTDLSGGQWQRLALARAFFRKAPVIILDEPTSAMDPWAEHDWLDRFRTMAQGKTSLVITHRFTLAMQADMIHVMRAGKIVESGTHTELLQHQGLYAQSWHAQMQTGASPPPESAANYPALQLQHES